MNQEELMAKYQPRQLENQVEFETIMSEMNNEQSLLNHPYIDRKMEIVKKRNLLNIQKQAIYQQISALSLLSIKTSKPSRRKSTAPIMP